MQILLFVMTMLLLLSAITYAKMDSYRSMVLFRNGFEAYSEARTNKFERDFYEFQYDKNKMTKTGPHDQNNKAEGISYISLAPLLNGEDSQFTEQLLKDLIIHLYEKQTFYQELLKLRPELPSEIVGGLVNGVKERGKSFKKIEELANIDLNDPILSEAFYKMLKGFTLPSKGSKETNESGYPSLTCYLSAKGSSKIRAYLAPRALLDILFNDPHTVNELMQLRVKIYQDLIAERITKIEEGNALFAETFSNKLNPQIPQDKVDFSVSKTNPNRKCVRFVTDS